MVDTTTPLPSITEPVIDRNRRWNPLWYRWMKPLWETTRGNTRSISEVSDTLGDLSATVTEVSEAVAGVSAQWGVTINLNGRVTGLVRLDSGATGSTFAVLADKFIVYNPANDGQSVQAFIAGLVNGVSTIGVNGDLIVDGTILARHIAVSTLEAISADIGDITAGTLSSADGNMVIDLNAKSIVMTV
jgi:hypothetical protein